MAVYQDVFCRMVASAPYRTWVVQHPDEALDGLDLTARERRRLLDIATQPGMRVSTAIHRANRLGPIDQTLPLTCTLLGDRLGGLLERYWMAHTTETLQVPSESARFAAFLEQEAASSRLDVPFLPDVLAFERACTDLAFATDAGAADAAARVRVVRFSCDPVPLLAALAAREPLPDDLTPGTYHLAIDARSGSAVFCLLDDDAVAWFASQGLI